MSILVNDPQMLGVIMATVVVVIALGRTENHPDVTPHLHGGCALGRGGEQGRHLR